MNRNAIAACRGAALGLGLAAAALIFAAPPAAAASPGPAESQIQCRTDAPGSHLLQVEPWACSIGAGGALSSFGNIVASPFISLVGQVTAPGLAGELIGASVSGFLTYQFQVTGGSVGDIVPVLISANLDTIGGDGFHGWALATLGVSGLFGSSALVAACSQGPGDNCADSFHGTVSVLGQSGAISGVQLTIAAFAGANVHAEFASASADPYIFVDPSFPNAHLYAITVSPGVANAPPVPEPPAAVLLGLGVLAMLARRRRRQHKCRRASSWLSPR